MPTSARIRYISLRNDVPKSPHLTTPKGKPEILNKKRGKISVNISLSFMISLSKRRIDFGGGGVYNVSVI